MADVLISEFMDQGAALDTLSVEPINDDTCSLFRGIDNLILTPHIAGVTQEQNKRIAAVAVANVAVANVRRVLGAPL